MSICLKNVRSAAIANIGVDRTNNEYTEVSMRSGPKQELQQSYLQIGCAHSLRATVFAACEWDGETLLLLSDANA